MSQSPPPPQASLSPRIRTIYTKFNPNILRSVIYAHQGQIVRQAVNTYPQLKVDRGNIDRKLP